MDPNWKVLMTRCRPDDDLLEVEVWYGDELWAIVCDQEQVIQFFHRQKDEPWAFKFEDVLFILSALAKEEAHSGKNEATAGINSLSRARKLCNVSSN